jgi:hypothetical protein
MHSKLNQGDVVADVQLPERNVAEKILLRARVPEGWKVISAKANGKEIPADENGTVNLTAFKGKVSAQFAVKQN